MASVDSIIAEQSSRANTYALKSESALREAMSAASSMFSSIAHNRKKKRTGK